MLHTRQLLSALLLLSVLLATALLPFTVSASTTQSVSADQAGECAAADTDGTCLDSEEQQQEEQKEEEEENKDIIEVFVTFVNEFSIPASLLWDNGREMAQVVDHIGPNGESVGMNSFVGHAFQWTREGNRDPLSDWFVMKEGIDTYKLTPAIANEVMARVSEACSDRNPRMCEREAAKGGCDRNPGWMIVNCPKACNRCELLDPKKRCAHEFLNVTAEHVWVPGEMDKLFLDILENQKQFGARAVSQPPEGPWIIVFDHFMDEAEADVLVEQGVKLGFERSTDTGEFNDRGEVTKKVSQSRTSSNAWCTDECERNPTVQRLTQRIEDITKIPPSHYEEFQLLQYFPGQFYRTHHDMGEVRRDIAGGHRILTFFVYLSDVEEGGETNFPDIIDPETGTQGLKVKAKAGQAVLWPSVLSDDPWLKDERTRHEALPVIKGIKYAANHWIHSHDAKIANLWGCTGAFS